MMHPMPCMQWIATEQALLSTTQGVEGDLKRFEGAIQRYRIAMAGCEVDASKAAAALQATGD